MKKMLLLNGPNLNLLGLREPEQYGRTTLADVEAMCQDKARQLGVELECFQSNWEGALIDKIHEYGRLFKAGQAVGAVFNPGAFTHTSYNDHEIVVDNLLEGGADLRVIQTLLGHADVATTEIYTHVLDDQLKALVLTHHPLAKKI